MIEWLENHFISCGFKSSFGIECPGCGTQRAFIALLKGDIMGSLHYHPGLIPFLVTLAILLIQLKIKHPQGGKWIMWSFITTVAITLVNYIIKQYLLYHP
ncbi:MAG: DUF2752 domain-containing protein [Bacteroidetes bacterium]|nr:DUF2752 domain-containing protein [Bacteroidota bacterium]